jgi:hypothetical protein
MVFTHLHFHHHWAGCILLGIDYDNLSDACQGLAGSFTCFAAAGWMTWYLSKKNLLPE